MDVSKLHDKEIKIMIKKMLNKVERRRVEHSEYFDIKLENIFLKKRAMNIIKLKIH